MRRNIKKAINEYSKRFGNRSDGKDTFYPTDILQIIDLLEEPQGDDAPTAHSHQQRSPWLIYPRIIYFRGWQKKYCTTQSLQV